MASSVLYIKETAYAKINLGLDITGRLPDGYHTLRMIMETINIHDDIEISVTDSEGISLKCITEGRALSVSVLSTGDDNLIIRAAKALLCAAAKKGHKLQDTGLDIILTKRIPMAAGLAGGSADAAAALRGINRLLSLGMTNDELCELGVTIGADIPYCIRGGSMLAEGIGDILTPLPAPPACHLLIAKPDIDVSTAYVYKRADALTAMLHPDIDRMIDALNNGDLMALCSNLGNVLRDVTVPEYPIVGELEDIMKKNGALGSLMSGSGPTVYGIFEDEADVICTLEAITGKYPGIYAVGAHFIHPGGQL